MINEQKNIADSSASMAAMQCYGHVQSTDLFGEPIKDKRNLSDWFIVPPFSILNVATDTWQARKKLWMKRINDKAQARSNVLRNYTPVGVDFMNIKGDTTSILDPVLCEVLLHWFTEENYLCFDPFAGDTVFGFCSSFKGRSFKGIELRQEQCDFNNTVAFENGLIQINL